MSEEPVESTASEGSAGWSAEEAKPAPRKPNRFSRSIQSRIQTARRWLHYRFPNVSWLHDLDSLEYTRQKDHRENAETRLTEGEELRVRALWGVELYGPTEIDGLYASLRRLGWDQDRLRMSDDGPTAWISTQRMYGSYGNFNLGTIHRPGEKRLFLVDRFAQMPAEVDYMHGYVYQASPSLTAIVLCFVLREEATHHFERILEKTYQTSNERGWRSKGYRIVGVYHAKERAVKAERERLRKLVSEWFADNIPGFFSSRDAGTRLPTAELLSTRQEKVLHSPGGTTPMPRWVQLIGKSGLLEVWRLEASEAISLAWDTADEAGQFHTVVSLRTDLLNEEFQKYDPGKNTRSYASIVSRQVEGALVHLAVLAGLLEIQRGLRLVRDTFPTASNSSRQALHAIRQIKGFFEASVGWPTIISDMAAQSQDDHYFRWYCEGFVTEPWRRGDTPLKIAEALQKRTHYIASRAISQEREARDHFEQMSAVLNTQEAIRTQRRMELLTVVATVLTGASLLVALLSIDSIAKLADETISRVVKSTERYLAETPNPSLEGTATGKALGPLAGQVNHPASGPSALPASAPQLKR